MNYAQTILERLRQGPGVSEIILSPGARPYVRGVDELIAFSEEPLAACDVLETLTTFLSHVPSGKGLLGKQGVFSFGMPNRGRFRVSYLMQRGSYAMSINEIPLDAPDLDSIWADPESASDFEKRIMSAGTGLFVFSSSSAMVGNMLAYALIKKLNKTSQRVIFALEPYITYMVRHEKSVVLQTEVGGDVETIEEGVDAALNLSPDMLYIRGVSSEPDLNAALRAVKCGVLTVLSIAQADVYSLFPSEGAANYGSLMQGLWRVEMSNVPGKLVLEV